MCILGGQRGEGSVGMGGGGGCVVNCLGERVGWVGVWGLGGGEGCVGVWVCGGKVKNGGGVSRGGLGLVKDDWELEWRKGEIHTKEGILLYVAT